MYKLKAKTTNYNQFLWFGRRCWIRVGRKHEWKACIREAWGVNMLVASLWAALAAAEQHTGAKCNKTCCRYWLSHAAQLCHTSSNVLYWGGHDAWQTNNRQNEQVKSCLRWIACYRMSSMHALLVSTAHSLAQCSMQPQKQYCNKVWCISAQDARLQRQHSWRSHHEISDFVFGLLFFVSQQLVPMQHIMAGRRKLCHSLCLGKSGIVAWCGKGWRHCKLMLGITDCRNDEMSQLQCETMHESQSWMWYLKDHHWDVYVTPVSAPSRQNLQALVHAPAIRTTRQLSIDWR